MNKNSAFLYDRADELDALCKLMQKTFPHSSVLCVDSLISEIKRLRQTAETAITPESWGYSINNVIMPLEDGLCHLVPSGINPRLCISSHILSDISSWEKSGDPFLELSFHATIYGDIDGEKYSFGVHIDRENREGLKEWHPLYHLHFYEGEKSTDSFCWGNLIHTDSPRVPHYPVDFILGIGWCLTNFYPTGKFSTCLKDLSFPLIYKRYQDWILKSYYQAISSIWGKCDNINWPDKRKLCPQIV